MRCALLAAVLGLAVLPDGGASAATFTGSWAVSGSALQDPGLVVAASGSPAFALDLEDGGSTSLTLFRLFSPEAAVGADDLVPRRLAVGLDFGAGAGGSLAATTVGRRGSGLQWGSVDWDGPIDIAVGGGGTLSVAFEDTIFNGGVLSLTRGRRFGADVRATFSYAAPVPLPPGLGLIALGCAALGLVARRRRRG